MNARLELNLVYQRERKKAKRMPIELVKPDTVTNDDAAYGIGLWQKICQYLTQLPIKLYRFLTFYSSLLVGHIITANTNKVIVIMADIIFKERGSAMKILPAIAPPAAICTSVDNVFATSSRLPLLKKAIKNYAAQSLTHITHVFKRAQPITASPIPYYLTPSPSTPSTFSVPLSLWERVRGTGAKYLFLLIFPLILTFSPGEKGTAWAVWTNTGGDHEGLDWTITGSTIVAGRHYNIGNFTIQAGATMTVISYDGSTVVESTSVPGYVDDGTNGGSPSGFIAIDAATVTIDGLLEASGNGYRGTNNNGEGPGGGGWSGSGGGGGGYGGLGGNGEQSASGGKPYGAEAGSFYMGSGGGGANGGGNGGGLIIISSSYTFSISGTGKIQANGGGTTWYRGGGAGGSIYIAASTISLNTGAIISAAGGGGGGYSDGQGQPGNNGSGGNGGGGSNGGIPGTPGNGGNWDCGIGGSSAGGAGCYNFGGGGGGGAGRIVIAYNTLNANGSPYTPPGVSGNEGYPSSNPPTITIGPFAYYMKDTLKPATNLSAIQVGTNINLSWTASTSPEATKYAIYRTTQPWDRNMVVIATATTTSYSYDIGATHGNGDTLYYRVRALDNTETRKSLNSSTSVTVSASWSNTGDNCSGVCNHNGLNWSPPNGVTISGYHYNINNFTIAAGATVYVKGYDGGTVAGISSYDGVLGNGDNDLTPSGFIQIGATNVTIDGVLEASERGYRGTSGNGEGPGGGQGNAAWCWGGGAGGGYGGTGGNGQNGAVGGSSSYSASTGPFYMGSSGGGSNFCGTYLAGNGGGLVIIKAASSFVVSGSGQMQANGGAGGAGGGIYIDAPTISLNNGTMISTAGGGGDDTPSGFVPGQPGRNGRGGNGGGGVSGGQPGIPGNGGNSYGSAGYSAGGGGRAGGGGAGRVYIKYTTLNGSSNWGSDQYWMNPPNNFTIGPWPWLVSTVAQTWTPFGGGDHGGADWTLSNGLNISGYHYNIGNFTIPSGATVYVNAYDGDSGSIALLPSGRGYADNGATPSGFVEIEAATVTVDGVMEASGKGYTGGAGGTYNVCQSGQNSTGTGNGGNGGNHFCGATGGKGSVFPLISGGPSFMGGGGGGGASCNGCGNPNGNGGIGGGLVIFKATSSLNVNGQIKSNGGTSPNTVTQGGGGGGGGNVYLESSKISIAAVANITSNGGGVGSANTPGTPGNPGAIVINYGNNGFNGNNLNGGLPGSYDETPFVGANAIVPDAYYRQNPPGTPSGLNANNLLTTSVDMSWNSVTGAANYQLEKSTYTTGYEYGRGYISVYNGAGISFTAPMNPGEISWFRVCSLDAMSTKSDYSNWVKVTAAPNPPTFTANKSTGIWYVSQTTVTFTTDWLTNGASYYRYVWITNPSLPVPFDDTVGAKWWGTTGNQIVSTMTSSGDWYLHVKSFNAEGNLGPATSSGPFKCDAIGPSIPFTPAFIPGNGAVLFSAPTFYWNDGTDPSPGSGVQGYDIRVSTSPNFAPIRWQASPTVASATWTSWTTADSGTFYWQVRARDALNTGTWIFPSTWSFNLDVFPPAAIENLTALSEGRDKEVRLNWTAPGDDGVTGTLTSYQVKYTQAGPITSTTAWTNATTYSQTWSSLQTGGSDESRVLTGLAAGTYYFNVRGVDDSGQLGDISNSTNTTAMAITKLVYSTAPVTMTVGSSTGIFTVVSVDGANTPVKANKNTVLQATSNSAAGRFDTNINGLYTSSSPFNITLLDGATNATFYYKDTKSGTSSVSVGPVSETWVSVSTTVTMNPKPPTKLAFATNSFTILAGVISPMIRVQSQDMYDNPSNVSANTTVNLATTTADGRFYLGASTTSTQTTFVNINAGAYESSFYFWPSQIGSSTVRASAIGLGFVDQTHTINPGPISKIVFAQGGAQTLMTGQQSALIKLEFQDQFGNPSPLAIAQNVNLTATSGGRGLSFDGSTWLLNQSTSVPQGATFFNVYYKDTAAGVSTITISETPSSSWTDATSAFTINPSSITKLAFIQTFTSLGVDTVSPGLIVQTQDQYNNPSPVTVSNRTIQFQTSSPGGRFSLAASPWADAASVEIAVGNNSALFYYKDTVANNNTIITVANANALDGWANAQFTAQIQGGTIVKLNFLGVGQLITAGSVSNMMQVQTQDVNNNMSSVDSPVVLTLTSDSNGCAGIGSCFSLSNSTNPWSPINTITMPAGANTIDFYYRDMKADYQYSYPDITVSAPPVQGWTSAVQEQTIQPGPLAKMAVVSSSQTINAGEASQQILIQTQDQIGNPQAVGSLVQVSLASNVDPSLYSFSQSTNPWSALNPAQIFINAGAYQPSSLLFYKSNLSGMHTLTFTANLPAPVGEVRVATQTIEVIGYPTRIVFTGTPPTSLGAGAATNPALTIQTKDDFGNPAPVRQNVVLKLTSNSPGAEFSLDGSIWGATTLTLSQGLYNASFYYKDSRAGASAITVSTQTGTNLIDGILPITIISGPARNFSFVHPSSSTAWVSAQVTIKAYDEYGNIANGYTGTVNFTALSGSSLATITPSSHTFIPADNGVKQVYLNDAYVETAQIQATDAGNSSVTGASNNIAFHGLMAEMTDSIMPAVCTQNQKDVGIVRIQLMTSTNTSTINSFTVRLSTGIADTDIAKVKLYADTNPNGIFEPGAGGVPGADLVLTESSFTASQVTLTLPSPQIISNVPKYYFVAYDIATEAALYANLGARILSPTYFSVSGLPVGSNNLPWSSKIIPIYQTPRTITLTFSNIMPGSQVLQGAANVGMTKFTMVTDAGTAAISGFRINKLGAIKDSDIAKLHIFRDFNGNGTYESGIDTKIYTTTSAFQSGLSFVQFAVAENINPTPKSYFIAIDISASAEVGASLGLGFTSNSYFTPTEMHMVGSANFPFNGSLISVTPTNDTMFVNATNLAPSDVIQGTRNLAMAKVALQANANTVIWKNLTLAFDGTGNGSGVDAVKIYRDTDGNGSFSASSDTVLTTGVDIFTNNQSVINLLQPEIIATTWQNYFITFDVSYLASVNKSIGGQWLTAGAFTLDGPFDRVASNAGPFSCGPTSVKEYADTVTASFAATSFTPASISQGSANVAITKFSLATDRADATWSKVGLGVAGSAPYNAYKAVKIYLDANGSGVFESSVDTLISPENLTFTTSLLEIPLSPSQTIRTIGKNYFVVIDLAADAPEGGRLAVSFSGSSAFIISFPNTMAGTNLPFTSGEATIAPVRVNPKITNLLPLSMGQGDIGIRVMRMDLNTDVSSTYVNGLKLTRTGQGSDLDLTAVEIYRDNGDLSFDAQTDIFLAATSLANGEVQISLQQPELITTSTQTYFVTLNVAGDAGVGNTLGLQLPFDAFSLSWGSVQLNSLPFATGAAFIKDYRTPSTPAIDHGGKFTSSFSQLKTKYDSKVTVGRITDVEYAIGTSSGATNVVSWTKTSVSTEILTNNLALENGKTYFVCVKTKSDSGFWSETGCSEGVTVDRVKPAISKPPRAFVEGKTVSVEWDSAQVGVSGVKGYKVEIKPGDKPTYTPLSALKGVIQWTPKGNDTLGVPGEATAAASEMVNTTAMVLQNIPYSSFYLRVTPVNGADVEGESSPPLKVIVWLPEDVIASISCYPNPFDSRKESIIINYMLNQDADVRLRIYDVFGGMIRSTSYGKGGTGGIQGPNDITWDGTDDNGNKVSQGIYILILEANGHKKRVKIALRH